MSGNVQELLQCQAALVKAQRWSGPFQRLLHVDALSKPEPKLPLCSQPSSPLTPAYAPVRRIKLMHSHGTSPCTSIVICLASRGPAEHICRTYYSGLCLPMSRPSTGQTAFGLCEQSWSLACLARSQFLQGLSSASSSVQIRTHRLPLTCLLGMPAVQATVCSATCLMYLNAAKLDAPGVQGNRCLHDCFFSCLGIGLQASYRIQPRQSLASIQAVYPECSASLHSTPHTCKLYLA